MTALSLARSWHFCSACQRVLSYPLCPRRLLFPSFLNAVVVEALILKTTMPAQRPISVEANQIRSCCEAAPRPPSLARYCIMTPQPLLPFLFSPFQVGWLDADKLPIRKGEIKAIKSCRVPIPKRRLMCDELALSTRPRTPDRKKKKPNNVMRQRTQAHDSRFSSPQVRRSLMQIVRGMKDRGYQRNDNNRRPRIGDSLCYSDGVIKENCAVVNGVRSLATHQCLLLLGIMERP